MDPLDGKSLLVTFWIVALLAVIFVPEVGGRDFAIVLVAFRLLLCVLDFSAAIVGRDREEWWI